MDARPFLLALLALLLVGPALAGDGGPAPAQDTTPPRVLGIEPSGGNVTIHDTEIVIAFSEPMNASVPGIAEVLHDGEPLPATLAWNANNTTLTVRLNVVELEYGTNYTVHVNYTAEDVERNRLDGNGDGTHQGAVDAYEETFRTEAVPEVPRQPAPLNPWIVFGIVVVALLVLYLVTRLQGS